MRMTISYHRVRGGIREADHLLAERVPQASLSGRVGLWRVRLRCQMGPVYDVWEEVVVMRRLGVYSPLAEYTTCPICRVPVRDLLLHLFSCGRVR